ncbi:MAG: DUF2188 domain-containing protein [Geobacteraceae bacterium]|nr:DUF2188 domain-containing protein [Geobacteraceae bacterium]
MPRKEHHVVPGSNGGWDVVKPGAQRVSVHTETKKEAIDQGRKISQNQGSEFIIHNKNGQISGSDSHGNDPFPPKG